MSNPDDFDILSDEPTTGGRSSRLWLLLVIGAAAIFLFAMGMAVATFRNRLGNNDGLPPSTTVAEVPTFTATPLVATTAALTATTDATTATATLATPTATEPSPPTATVTSLPTVPPPPTVTPGCARTIPAQFAGAYQPELGCPTNDANMIWAAWEWFERGGMFWRDDNDRAYAFFADTGPNSGGWRPVDEKWEGQEPPSRGEPPPGLQAPVRGFGYAWGQQDELFQRLGWATDQERGFCALVQDFEGGFIVQSSDVESCKDNLFNQARLPEWRPLLITAVSGQGWRNLADTPLPTPIPTVPVATNTAVPTGEIPTATPTTVPTAMPTATVATTERQRPEGNRLFLASSGSHNLDAEFDDWGNNWIPITAVVQGEENYNGTEDANGDFQVSWSGEGLYLAIRVRDDRYRAGPTGTDMWQGDMLEVHFDRDLGGDYPDYFVNSDDYQLGIGFGAERNEVRLYRWLPLEQEGVFPIAGAVVAEGEGYRAEVLIPWTLFNVTGDQLQSDQRFGFNLSISDNDADAPAQESVLSASPSRTTYNNPTEWGTLILQ